MTSRPFKVAVLGSMTDPSGAPLAALRLAAGFAERGYSTSVAFLYDRVPIEGGDHPYTTMLARPPASLGDYVRMLMGLWQWFRRERPTVLITFLPLASVLGCWVARFAGVPVRIVSHRVPRSTYTPAMRRLDTMSARWGAYTGVVAVSKSVAASCGAYPNRLKRRMTVIYNGLRGFQASPLAKDEARRRLGLPVEVVLAVAVGRLDRQKNYPVLLEALARTDERVHLAVAGEGGDRQSIEALIVRLGLDSRVHLLGAIPRSEIVHLLRAGDLFVQPSLFEGQSNALLEALHAGLPCFVSDAPEQVETVSADDGRIAGAVLGTHDAEAWSQALRRFDASRWLDDEGANIVRGRAGVFTYQRMMDAFEGLVADKTLKQRT